MWLRQVSLLGGWLPIVVATVAWAAFAFGIAWRRRSAWQWLVVAAGALFAALIVAWILAQSRVPTAYPRSFIVWGSLPVFALGAALWQWRLVGWRRTTVALLSVPALAVFGGLQINAYYAYLPTLGDLLVVCRGFGLVGEGGAASADFGDDGFGGLVPDEGFGVVVPV